MDWRSVNFDWNRARAFLVTAEEGSFSAAAQALGVAQPTLGRQVAALEQELGVVLFERHANAVELTPQGVEMAHFVRRMAQAANEFSLSASGHSQSLSGPVTLSATELMAVHLLPPILTRLKQQHPGLHLQLIATNSSSDLMRREADIAIRAYRPTEPELIARKVRQTLYGLYASADYLDSLDHYALEKMEFVGFDQADQLLTLIQAFAPEVTLAQFTTTVNHNIANWSMVKSGAGVGVMLTEIGDAEPGIRRVFPELTLPSTDIWLVAHRELRTSRRVRLVYDYLAQALETAN
ncbi:LysR family transcriptional regulator [Saccharospirillum mangrovi]|uniref:LysR family transcriptional regulator n=1 Tax=Saccharospirillum mangrovi TaxID=2161747 RepID=UPI000D35EE1F|nr:LysR family transcriptional regulator [Saccharospirillum mangrovi]